MSLPSLNKVITYLRSDHDQTPERSPWCPSTLWYHNQERAHSTCHQVPQEQKQRPHFTQSHKERKIRKAYLAWNLKKNYRGVKPHSMSTHQQEKYWEQYPHIASEIVNGSGRQSAQSDIFSLGKIVLAVLDLLPTATARSLKVARTALRRASKTPLLKGTLI